MVVYHLKGVFKLGKPRNKTIDVLRGIATISVLAGHAIQRGMVTGYEENIIFKIIYTYHMPLFMLLAGYTLYLSNPKYDVKFLLEKIKRLIIPTVIFSYLLYFIKDLNFTGLQPFVKFPNGIMEYTKKLIVNPDFLIWFLYVVFVCTFIFYIGKNLFNRYLPIYLLAVTVIIMILPFGFLGLWRVKLHLPIFIVGYCIAMYKDIFFKYLKYALIPSIIFYIFMFDKWSFSSSKLYQWLIAFAGITIIYYLVKVVRIKALDNSFAFFGKYSLGIYLWQCVCLNIGIGEDAIRVISIFITATAISTLLAYLTNKNKYSRAVFYGSFKWIPKAYKANKKALEL